MKPHLVLVRNDDASLRAVREAFGHGSTLARACEVLVARDVADLVTHWPEGEWVERCRQLSREEPELGARVERLVRARAARVVMGALGAWLEDVAPWLFEVPAAERGW